MSIEISVAVRSKKPYVYALAYPDGLVFYIGKGKGSRIYRHEQEARGTAKERNAYKCRVIRKIWANGGQVQKIVLGCFDNEQEALLYEFAVTFLMDGLTNACLGGGGTPGLPISEEHKQVISSVKKGRTLSDEHKRRISEAMTGKKRHNHRPLKPRKPHTEEAKLKMSLTQKGKPHKPHTEETRLKMSLVQKTVWAGRKLQND